MKRLFVFAGIGFALINLTGCGGGNGSTTGASLANALIGTWRTTQLRSPSGTTVTCPGSFTLPSGTLIECTAADDITFVADGTLVNVENGVSTPGGNWNLNGTTLRIIVPTLGGVFTVDATAVISGNTLTLTLQSSTPPAPEGNGTVTTLVKQ